MAPARAIRARAAGVRCCAGAAGSASFPASSRETTNNRMELRAAIGALEALKRPMTVRLHTDSNYLRSGVTTWLPGWKANGWRTADKKPVKNQDLWRALEAALGRHRVEWRWVRGHSGNPDNERADQLAREAIRAGRAAAKAAG